MTTSGSKAPTAYRPFAITLHWLVALLVISTIPAGLVMTQDDLPRQTQDMLFIFHKNVGVVIFVLVAARLAFRLFNPAPPLPASVPHLQRVVAALTHWLLYAALLAMSVSGYIYVKAGGYPIEGLDAMGVPSLVPRSDDLSEGALAVHEATRFGLVVLIALHIAAALYHALIKRDGVFTRMAPFLRR